MQAVARLSREDWIEAGFAALVKSGREGLAAERLAERLGVTRGSFYHHFRSAEDYARTLLSAWERRTEQIIAFSRVGETVDQRAERLTEAVVGGRHALDVAIRAWALRDEIARRYQARVDALRTDYVREIYEAIFADERAARLAADIIVLCFVGAQQVQGHESPAQLRAVIGKVREVVMSGARAATTRRQARKADTARRSRSKRFKP